MEELKFEEFSEELEGLEKVAEGWRGVVYRGRWRGKEVAVKVAKRPEAEEAVRKEAEILEALKGREGYPQIILKGADFFVYEFIKGKRLRDLDLSPEEKKRIYAVLLEKAYELDRLGIRRDEFSYVEKNVLVDEEGKVYVIDFDRGSFSKRPSNLTQFLQLLVREGFLSREEAVKLGKRYRKDMEGVFEEVMRRLKF